MAIVILYEKRDGRRRKRAWAGFQRTLESAQREGRQVAIYCNGEFAGGDITEMRRDFMRAGTSMSTRLGVREKVGGLAGFCEYEYNGGSEWVFESEKRWMVVFGPDPLPPGWRRAVLGGHPDLHYRVGRRASRMLK